MNSRFFFLTFGLIAMLPASCAAPATLPDAPPNIPTNAPPSAIPTVAVFTPQNPVTSAPQALPVATSRGDKLEATDPAAVSLASGGLQLVEFFRFT